MGGACGSTGLGAAPRAGTVGVAAGSAAAAAGGTWGGEVIVLSMFLCARRHRGGAAFDGDTGGKRPGAVTPGTAHGMELPCPL